MENGQRVWKAYNTFYVDGEDFIQIGEAFEQEHIVSKVQLGHATLRMMRNGNLGVFDIILHNYGPNLMIGSLHINVYDTMNAHEIHGLTRRITEQIFERHGIILTVGIYAIATGSNKRSQLQSTIMQALSKHPEIVQVHGFYYFEKEHRASVDIVPDISVHDEAALSARLTEELKALVPDEEISIVIDHNYSE